MSSVCLTQSRVYADPVVGSENISKQFSPHPAKRFEPGDHYYLFVDFSSAEEAQTAMDSLNGQEGPWGASLRVQRARGATGKPDEGSRATEAPATDGEA
jgi:hypothetical protein